MAKWTIDSITLESKKYKTKVEFMKGNVGAYSTCMRRFPGLIDKLYANQIKPVGYWTRDKIIDEAKKYKTKNELRVNCSSAYTVALKNHPWLLDELFEGKGKKRWTKELIIEESKKYDSKAQFQYRNGGAYCAAIKRFPGLLDELFTNNITRYTKEHIIEEAGKYASKGEFQKKNVALYRSAWGKFPGLLDTLFDNINQSWSREKLVLEAMKYDRKVEFLRINSGAYSTLHRGFPGLIDLLFINQPTYTKDNSIYCWHLNDDIYKIGVTSNHLGEIRIRQVTKALKINFNKVKVLRVAYVEKATKLEKQLLKIGKPVQFDKKFDGSTEFRHLTDDELNQVLAMIDAATIQQEQAA